MTTDNPEYAYECDNCGEATTEHGECHVCGALPWETKED
ncbi:hypothetical protein SAMN05216285_4191 [Natrinema salifodinae]|uniref:Uncharacterized protein n=1 Tax=Natrinema salifodinae TaxID=1202768 RepID=A0A1I0QZ02_9EURY|nr:hypothetical protein SAMN05216285_4191 [Natrinema salifodinae]